MELWRVAFVAAAQSSISARIPERSARPTMLGKFRTMRFFNYSPPDARVGDIAERYQTEPTDTRSMHD
jgi:hypothetical protein